MVAFSPDGPKSLTERLAQIVGRFLFTLVCCSFIIPDVAALGRPTQARRRPAKAESKQPSHGVKLVVGIVIDQFRYDYLTRFADLFGAGGFRRLTQEGAVFANANYPYTPTITACGHAAFMSGATPSSNGIIGNDWFDRATGKVVTSVSDPSTKRLGGNPALAGSSPHRLVGTMLGDEMRMRWNGQAKVVGVSFKDRSAILPAGKRPTGAYWYDDSNGAFISSTYYFADLPEWVKKFNREQSPDRYFGKSWERLLPGAAYARAQPDNSPYERWKYGTTFPHVINGREDKPGPNFYAQFEYTPFANEQLAAFAKAAIENEQLGQDDIPDLLTVSFSANDLVGHFFGPDSQEVEDMTVRTDRVLADFFDYLDRKVGLQNTVIVFTADHGVSPIPELMQERGLGGRIDLTKMTLDVDAALSKRFGEEKWVRQLANNNFYFDEAVLERRKVSPADAERIACETALATPGIAACYTRTQILSGNLPNNKIARSVAEGFYAERNGNAVLVQQPFWGTKEGNVTTSHSTPYSYDTHVPVILMGPKIRAEIFQTASAPTDIAPTLAALLGINPPSNATGRVLVEAIKTSEQAGN